MNNVRFFKYLRTNSLYVSTPDYPNGSGAIFHYNTSGKTYPELVEWWSESSSKNYCYSEIPKNAEEILPDDKEPKMTNTSLDTLFSHDFVVQIDYDEARTLRTVALFEEVKNMGIGYKVDECFENTWMGREGYSPDNWGYFGLLNGRTYIQDTNWSGHPALSVDEFEALVVAAREGGGKSVIVLGTDTPTVVEGGVVVVTYKDGQQYHLYNNGKATLNVADRTVTTERTFLKDGQEAYERVIIKIEKLDNVESDSLKLSVLEDGKKISFTTTYVL